MMIWGYLDCELHLYTNAGVLDVSQASVHEVSQTSVSLSFLLIKNPYMPRQRYVQNIYDVVAKL